MAWRRSVVVWARAIYQYHVNGMNTVGRSVDARGPVDHASVGLAQAHPKKHIMVYSPWSAGLCPVTDNSK